MGNFVKEPEDLSGAVMVDVTVLRVCCTLWVWTMTSDGIETREKWPHNLICSLFHILIYFTFVFSYIYITADLWPRLFPCFTLHSVCVCVLAGHCSVSCWTPDLFHIKGRISQAPAIHCFYSGFLFVGLLIIVKMETQQCFNCEQSWCKLDDGNKEPLYKKDCISSPKGDNKGSTEAPFLCSLLPSFPKWSSSFTAVLMLQKLTSVFGSEQILSPIRNWDICKISLWVRGRTEDTRKHTTGLRKGQREEKKEQISSSVFTLWKQTCHF